MKKILIIEDDSITRTILKTVLSSEYEVIETHTAEDGLNFYQNVDLIICDFHLPGMSGLQFAEKIKDSKIPVIMLTAESDPEQKEKSKKIGVKGWFTKPFSPDFLAKQLRNVFKE